MTGYYPNRVRKYKTSLNVLSLETSLNEQLDEQLYWKYTDQATVDIICMAAMAEYKVSVAKVKCRLWRTTLT